MKGLDTLSKKLQKTLGKTDCQAVTQELAQSRPQLESLTRDNPVVPGP